MTTQSPFPELKPFETPPRLPSMESLMAALPHHDFAKQENSKTKARNFPSFPMESTKPPAPASPPTVKKPLPAPPRASTAPPSPSRKQTPTAPMPTPMASVISAAMDDDTPPATDDDLRRALEPVVESSLERVLYAPDKGLHTYLEPMLRSTVRRAIAEQIDAAVQFRSTGTVDRLGWRLKALMTSRSYDEVVFRSTRRYQVEEAYLLRREDYSLVSFASHDPARHASEKRVEGTVKKLVRRLTDDEGNLRKAFDYADDQVAIIRQGKHTLLVALVRGRSNALVRADLDYVLRQAEDRFGERLEDETDAFLHVLQPILEGCLLIQSPAPPS
ncbi:hypothetical protein AAFN60_14960 [Roseibacillus persicicus]|uniref:hypothetical protein n=1 Tax=Roseibacillus persicicus TaxID=454148 RepID=UPI00398ABC31